MSSQRGRIEDSFNLVNDSLTDVDDHILHWELAPGSWGLRNSDGFWIPDYDRPNPKAPGPKTIGWLIAHIGSCKEKYYEYAFGPALKQWESLEIPGDIKGLRNYLELVQQPLVNKLETLTETDLKKPVLTNWGELKPIWWVYWIMISHDIEHGGQIFQIKREYLNRHVKSIN